MPQRGELFPCLRVVISNLLSSVNANSTMTSFAISILAIILAKRSLTSLLKLYQRKELQDTEQLIDLLRLLVDYSQQITDRLYIWALSAITI